MIDANSAMIGGSHDNIIAVDDNIIVIEDNIIAVDNKIIANLRPIANLTQVIIVFALNIE